MPTWNEPRSSDPADWFHADAAGVFGVSWLEGALGNVKADTLILEGQFDVGSPTMPVLA